MLGEAYFKSERLKEAEHWYRQALTVKADHIPAHLTYGKLLTRIVIPFFISLIVWCCCTRPLLLSLPLVSRFLFCYHS